MTNRVLHRYLIKTRTVGKFESNGIGDSAFFRVVIVRGKRRIFNAAYLRTQGIDTFVLRHIVLIVCRR